MVLEHGANEFASSWPPGATRRNGFGTRARQPSTFGRAACGEVRYGRIAAVRRKIQAGTYRISTADLAEVLLGRMFTSHHA